MNAPIVACVSNRASIGTTSLIYHLAWMMALRGIRVVAADLYSQVMLTDEFLDNHSLDELYGDNTTSPSHTVTACLDPIRHNTGIQTIAPPHLIYPDEERDTLALFAGDMALAEYEDDLAVAWSSCLNGDAHACQSIATFWHMLRQAAAIHRADMVLVDSGPHLGSVTRAVLLASDAIIVHVLPDVFALHALQTLGATMYRWRTAWRERVAHTPASTHPLPAGAMHPIGYVVRQPVIRFDYPVPITKHWPARVPQAYRHDILAEPTDENVTAGNDPHALAVLQNYHILMPIARDVKKPMFSLKPADGAMGSILAATREAYREFLALAQTIGERIGVPVQ